MEHINGGIVCHGSVHLLVGSQEEVIEGFVGHVIVFDLACGTFVVDVVRRIGDDQVCLGVAHEQFKGFRLGAVSADQTVAAQLPNVTSFGEGGLLQLCIYIEAILLHPIFQAVLEQVVNLRRLEASQRYIKVGTLQISNQQSQLILIPVAADFVEGDVEGFFLGLIHFHHNAINLGQPHVHQNFQTLVAADHTASGFIPDDRLYIAKLLNGAFQFFVLGIAGFQIFSGVVVSGQKVCRMLAFNNHTRPHSAKASKPPMERMKALAVSTIFS